MILQVLPLRGYEKRVCIYIYTVLLYSLPFPGFFILFYSSFVEDGRIFCKYKEKKIFIFGC